MSPLSPPQRILVVTLDAYRFSTRSRKAAQRYATIAPTVFLGLAAAGRTGRWDVPGEWRVDAIDVVQVRVKQPWVAPTRRNQLRNLFISYLPAFARLAKQVLTTPADVVHVTGAPLVILALLHRARFRSITVLDIQERPGAPASRGSVMNIFSRIELFVLRAARRWVDIATVVTYGDVGIVSALGFPVVMLVRNAPLLNWRASFIPPPKVEGGLLRAVAIGSIFEGRGYEILIRAIAKAQESRRILVSIYGPGREDYLNTLRGLASALGVDGSIEWMGTIDSSEVSAAYLRSHVGLVLYESADAGNDGLSNKILECVSTGRPVIAGDLPENRKFVAENHVGWLTDVAVEGLAETLTHAAQDVDLEELSCRCRGYGDTWLNWESEFAKLLNAITPGATRGALN